MTEGNLVTQAEAAERRLAESSPAPAPAETAESGELVALIRTVVRDPNFDIEKLRELRAIHKEMKAEQNEQAFADALARAQAVMPVVRKNKHVNFPLQGKPPVDYHHADYGALVKAIKPCLAAEGLAFSHSPAQQEGDGRITVSCVLSGYGHSVKVTLSAMPEGSPGMNEIQKMRSARTYLKRETLEMVTGAATEDDDDDGRGASGQPELIGASELAFLNAEIEELGADRGAFLEYLKVEALEDLPASDFAKAKAGLEAKRRAKAKEVDDTLKQGADMGAPAEDAEPEPHETLIP